MMVYARTRLALLGAVSWLLILPATPSPAQSVRPEINNPTAGKPMPAPIGSSLGVPALPDNNSPAVAPPPRPATKSVLNSRNFNLGQ
jgi:hypothetical protein